MNTPQGNPGNPGNPGSTSEKKEFVLFYSPNCKFCKNFLTKLKSKMELLKKTNLVDIDNITDIPEEVDEIPCIYDGKKVFKGPEAFKWFDDKSVEFLDLTNKKILILGAGGTIRTIIYALKNSNIFVTNRTKNKLIDLKKDFKNINLVDILDKNFLNSIDFLINTTTKNQNQINLISTNDLKLLNKNCIIYDINYQKQDTFLIRESKKIGLQTIDGLNMLINQAAKSFFHWFKILPLVTKELNQILLQELK